MSTLFQQERCFFYIRKKWNYFFISLHELIEQIMVWIAYTNIVSFYFNQTLTLKFTIYYWYFYTRSNINELNNGTIFCVNPCAFWGHFKTFAYKHRTTNNNGSTRKWKLSWYHMYENGGETLLLGIIMNPCQYRIYNS